MGYLAFKRALKSKRQMECLDRKFVDPRFRSMFLNADELSVIPEQMDWSTAETDSNVNPNLVKKDRSQNRYSNGRLPTPIRKHCTLSSLPRPIGDLQISWPDARGNLSSPDLLCARSTDLPCSKMPGKQRSELKVQRNKTKRASGNFMQECSGTGERSEDKGLPAKFDKNVREKLIPLSNDKDTLFRSRSSKLLRPLGTGCFSASFQAISQIEKRV